MILKTYSEKNAKEKACMLCLEHRLYVDGWSLKHWFTNHDFIIKLVVMFDNEKPIGVGVLSHHTFYNVGIYVKDEYRRKGYGTRIFKRLLFKSKCRVYRCCGVFPRQKNFFQAAKNSLDNESKRDKVCIK